MLDGETEEEYTERMRDPGRQALPHEYELYFPESRAQRAARALSAQRRCAGGGEQ